MRAVNDGLAIKIGVGLLAFAALAALVWPRSEAARALDEVADQVPQDAIVVVDDIYAEHIGAMLARPAPVFMTARDLDRHAKTVPCVGPIFRLTQHPERVPGRLRPHPVVGTKDVVGAKLVEHRR